MRAILLLVVLTAALLLAGCPPLPQVTPESGQPADPAANLYGCSAE